MCNKITQKCSPETAQSSPKAAPGLQKPSPNKLPYRTFWSQDRFIILLGRSWAVLPLPKRFFHPLGRLREAPGPLQERFSNPPGTTRRPPRE